MPSSYRVMADQAAGTMSAFELYLLERQMPFPTTDMDGHARLRDRVDAALDRAVETASVEFKESAAWDTFKWKIIKTVMGMGNLRDGGLIIVGVSARGETWQLDGITEADRDSFDPDDLASDLDLYVSPPPHVEVVLHQRDQVQFLVLDVGEFDEIPFICRRNGPDGEGLKKGDFFHRPLGLPRTKRVNSAEDMRPILQLAAEKGARNIIELMRRVGGLGPGAPEPTDDDEFDREMGDL